MCKGPLSHGRVLRIVVVIASRAAHEQDNLGEMICKEHTRVLCLIVRSTPFGKHLIYIVR